MSALNIGDLAPEFTLPTDNGGNLTLHDMRGQYVVIYFYPKDDTPGCTKQAIGFTEFENEFSKLKTKIIGISPDNPAKHDKFKTKHNLSITLAADEEQIAANAFDVWVEKSMYGKTYMGIERSTFLIDPNGQIVDIWRKVKVAGHVESVLQRVKEISSN